MSAKTHTQTDRLTYRPDRGRELCASMCSSFHLLDRLVILGSHRDAWSHGAIDPGGGNAVMLEMSRVVGELLKEGWRPRRTLIFASWGAEEFGLIGSTEWVEVRQRCCL